jgi:hypothetical protein
MAYPIVPLINGKSYEWADIIVNVLGVPIIGIANIEYEEKQAMENVYGAGRLPVSRGYGKIEPTAKMTILMEELENIQTVAPLGRIQDIPEFDIVVAFVDSALITRKHVLKNVRFMNNKRASSSGDTSIPIELELIISHIEFVS